MTHKLREGLSVEHVAHPMDRFGMQKLINQLSKSTVTKNQIENLQTDAEEEFYIFNLADNTKLSESQGGSVYRLVQEVSEILGVSVPHVFLDTTPEINAYALGGTNPAIVLTSAIVDSFPEPILRVVIAHEIGHIICKHTFYRLLADNFNWFSKLVELIPFVGSLCSVGIQLPLFNWYRKSELSADRVALLGTQDINAVQDCILRLAGGSSRLAHELKISEFAIQAKEFQDRMKAKREQNIKDRVGFLFSGFMLQHAMSTHPWPAVRLQEIRIWSESEQYMHLVAGDYKSALAAVPLPTDDDQNIGYTSPGEDAKEYIKDLGKLTGDTLKGFFKKHLNQPNDTDYNQKKEGDSSDK